MFDTMNILLAHLFCWNGSKRKGMPARYSADSACIMCSPSFRVAVHERLRAMDFPVRTDRQRRSAATMQTVNSGASRLKFEQTSCSSNCPRLKSSSSRSRSANTLGMSSTAANRSAELPERTRARCSSMSSRMVNPCPPALVIQSAFEIWLPNRAGLPKIFPEN